MSTLPQESMPFTGNLSRNDASLRATIQGEIELARQFPQKWRGDFRKPPSLGLIVPSDCWNLQITGLGILQVTITGGERRGEEDYLSFEGEILETGKTQ